MINTNNRGIPALPNTALPHYGIQAFRDSLHLSDVGLGNYYHETMLLSSMIIILKNILYHNRSIVSYLIALIVLIRILSKFTASIKYLLAICLQLQHLWYCYCYCYLKWYWCNNKLLPYSAIMRREKILAKSSSQRNGGEIFGECRSK